MLADRNGPRPPSRGELERELDEHLTRLLEPLPRCLDEQSRPPLGPWLVAHRDWRLAELAGRDGRAGDRVGGDGGAGGPGHLGLRLAIALTFLGDVGTVYAALSVVANTPPVITALLVVALAVTALFLAHGLGRELRLRRLGRGELPGAAVAVMAVVWLGVGVLAATVRLAAPLNSAGGFGTGQTDAVISVVLAVLLFLLYAASGLAAAALGFRTGDPDRPAPPGGRIDLVGAARVGRARRQRVAAARTHAWFRVLAATAALRVAEEMRDPSVTDAATAPADKEIEP